MSAIEMHTAPVSEWWCGCTLSTEANVKIAMPLASMSAASHSALRPGPGECCVPMAACTGPRGAADVVGRAPAEPLAEDEHGAEHHRQQLRRLEDRLRRAGEGITTTARAAGCDGGGAGDGAPALVGRCSSAPSW